MKKICSKTSRWLPYATLGLLITDFYLIFLYAPIEKYQGLAQKIFYFHVSSAFSMYVCFLFSGIGAALYLWKKTSFFNAMAHAGASVGVLFCAMVLTSGPIWAKPIWGAFWTWDPRLTTTLILFLIFFAVLLLREFYGTDLRGRIYAAVLTLFGLLDIPLIILSVKLWRGVHPAVLGEKDNMPFEMKITLFFTLITVFALMFCLLQLKTRQAILQDRFDEMSAEAHHHFK